MRGYCLKSSSCTGQNNEDPSIVIRGKFCSRVIFVRRTLLSIAVLVGFMIRIVPVSSQPCLINDTSSLISAIENATTDLLGPPTIIEICQEVTPRIGLKEYTTKAPPLSLNYSIIPDEESDVFGLDVSNRNIELVCRLNNETQPRCSLGVSFNHTTRLGLIYANNAKLSISGFNLVNGGSMNHSAGGAIQAVNGSIVTIKDCVFLLNRAVYGGSIYAETSTILLEGQSNSTRALFDWNNLLPTNGNNRLQVPEPFDPTSLLKSILFVGNLAWSGGAIDSSGNDSTIIGTNVAFFFNLAMRYGGAMCLFCASTTNITNSVFIGNYADGDGGAFVASTNASASIETSIFAQNAAHFYGSVAEVAENSIVKLIDCSLNSNIAAEEDEEAYFGDDALPDWTELLDDELLVPDDDGDDDDDDIVVDDGLNDDTVTLFSKKETATANNEEVEEEEEEYEDDEEDTSFLSQLSSFWDKRDNSKNGNKNKNESEDEETSIQRIFHQIRNRRNNTTNDQRVDELEAEARSAAIRSGLDAKVELVNTVFLENKNGESSRRRPSNIHLYDSGTVTCSNVTFCNDRGLDGRGSRSFRNSCSGSGARVVRKRLGNPIDPICSVSTIPTFPTSSPVAVFVSDPPSDIATSASSDPPTSAPPTFAPTFAGTPMPT